MDFSGLQHLNELKAEWQLKNKVPLAISNTTTPTTTAAFTTITDAKVMDLSSNGHNSDLSSPPKPNVTANNRDKIPSQLINNKQYIELQQCEHKDVVIIAKHLCGAATDLAIRSLLAYKVDDKATGTMRSASGSSDTNGSSGSSGSGVVLDARANGCAIATCCHHVNNLLFYYTHTSHPYYLDNLQHSFILHICI